MASVHFYGGAREWFRPVIVEEDELFLSPAVRYETDTTRFRPPGAFNVADILATLPAPYCRPDLVTVMFDEGGAAEGLEHVEAKKVLFVGDTHHGERPIEKRVKAAITQPWDLVVTEFCPHHVTWFQQAGAPRTVYIPCFNINPRKLEPKRNPTRGIVFIGQVGAHHPRRRFVIEELQKRGYPVLVTQCHQQQAAELYNDAVVSLNIPLNGDKNYRQFEIFAAGGLVQQCDTMELLVARVEWIFGHREDAFAVVEKTFRDYWRENSPASWLIRFGHELAIPHGPRHPCPDTLWPRIAAYEALQERQRMHVADEPLEVAVADQQTADDARTLARLKVRVG